MAKMMKCPVCGSSVKPENLEKHLKKVHPGEDVDIGLSEDEQRAIRAKGRRGVRPREGAVVAIIAFIIVIIVTLAILYEPPPNNKEGEIASHFTITDVNSNLTMRFPQDFYNEVVFLEFFKTDCTFCKNFVPTLNTLYDNYHNDVNFISIDSKRDDTEQDVRDFIENQGSREWTYALDTSGEITEAYDVVGWPRSFIIDLTGDVEGTIVKDHTGVTSYNTIASELDELLS